MRSQITQIIDLLTPGLYAVDKDHQWYMSIDYMTDSIRLKSVDQDHLLLTREEIDDNLYKELFKPRLAAIIGDKNGKS